jgi:transcriptional regulator with XRE-family HTH domain
MAEVLRAGQRLREIRERLGLVLKDVETASRRISEECGNQEFTIITTRLSEIETKDVPPTIFRLYSLAAIYRMDLRELLAIWGIDLSRQFEFSELKYTKTHRFSTSLPHAVSVPFSFDVGTDTSKTFNLARAIQQWGILPLSYLEHLVEKQYTYVYIGEDDYTMAPLLTPGSVVQVDEALTRIDAGPWPTEGERPLYLVEFRNGNLVCCWCSVEDSKHISLVAHPLSSVKTRIISFPYDAEIIGKVIAVFKRLHEDRPAAKVRLQLHDSDVDKRRPN